MATAVDVVHIKNGFIGAQATVNARKERFICGDFATNLHGVFESLSLPPCSNELVGLLPRVINHPTSPQSERGNKSYGDPQPNGRHITPLFLDDPKLHG